MKTFKCLYPSIVSWDNLVLAWQKARCNKRYTSAAATFEQALDRELLNIQDELVKESYLPDNYRSFTIHEPKRRKISAAPFRDRVVHHALCNVIELVYERKFIFDSYANRRGKGTHAALDQCTTFMRRYRYVLPCDIQQYFPAIDHEILKAILARVIACPSTMHLCEKIIDSGRGILKQEYDLVYFPNDNLLAALRPRGLPIGNLTSQFWANVYLNELDQFVKHQLHCKGYLRYVDDFLLFADDKITLHHWRVELIDFLQTLRLRLHEKRAYPRPVTTGIPFLGLIVFPDHRRLIRRNGIRYQRHLNNLYQQYLRGEIQQEVIITSMKAWLGHAMHADTYQLRSKIFRKVIL
ncbi:MAG: reverse transcriptase/maturase family protein [Anaerolineaceae bacterium]|nr:reverse transcriptase/maturase family protein [Anaerolineaceae bacterium]